MSSQDPYEPETYVNYQDYQKEIKSLLRVFIRNFGKIQLMHRLGKMTTQNTAKFLDINVRKANIVRTLYKQWTMGSFDL